MEDINNRFINRELSWLEFNVRVLEEAVDWRNPLLERLKFISIVSSNLDEFFMVRVASLWDQVKADFCRPDPAGMTPSQQLKEIRESAGRIFRDQYDCFNYSLIPQLEEEGIYFLKSDQLDEEQKKFVRGYYIKNIFPVLTPMVVDQSRPFPLIFNKSLNIALLVRQEDQNEQPLLATVQVPEVLGRYIEIPSEGVEKHFILLEEMIMMNIDTLFKGHEILTMGTYRVTRNADLGIDEEGAEDLLQEIEQSLKERKWSAVIRLEVEDSMENRLLNVLQAEMEVPGQGIYQMKGPLDLTFLMDISSLDGYDHLRYQPLPPLPVAEFMGEEDIFNAIAKRDIIMHHPYQSFDPVINLVQQAAVDPHVLAIKQTLYRVSGESPLVKALAQAAENGKQVTVLVELKARFDEENNIQWARRLEQAGCHVIYGLVGLKTHCKTLLIVRKEAGEIKRYVHMGTGNYNDITARIYTDLGVFTTNPYFGADLSSLFNMLSGYSELSQLYKVEVAPVGIRDKFMALIKKEAKNAKNGLKARIMARMNALVDEEIIEALYEASQAGVEIDLIVRGICCLRPDIPGVSENIHVRSIIGRFLEHSRVYYFYNGGNELIYLSSADWMPRNLDRRVELLFPVEDEDIRCQVKQVLEICLADTERARVLQRDGSYYRIREDSQDNFDSQMRFYELAEEKVRKLKDGEPNEEFRPMTKSREDVETELISR